MKIIQVEEQVLKGVSIKAVDLGSDNNKVQIGADLTDGERSWRVVGHVYPDRNETRPIKILMSEDFSLTAGDECFLKS